MKKLTTLIFIITSLTGFSQEKKGICAAGINLFHDSGNDSISDDHFNLNGFNLGTPLYYGSFLNVTTWSDSVTYEITLPFGDSLLYSAYWHADGMCFENVDSADVNSLISILEGIPFSITHEGYYSTYFAYDISQKAVIRNACFFKIQRKNYPWNTYFIRVKFQDPPLPETPLDLPEITNDISMWLSSENTLSVKADQDAVWDIHFYSLSGQLIQQSVIEGSQSVDVSSFPKGCYIVCAKDQMGTDKRLNFVR
jgi:hypothetical protein